MAQLDPSIFLQTRPKSAFDYLQEMAQAEDMGQRREMNKLAMLAQRGTVQDAQQARDTRNRATAAIQGLGGNATIDQRISAADSVGAYDVGDALRKRQIDERTAMDNQRKASAEVVGKLMGFQKDLAGRVLAAPTRENAIAAVQQMAALAKSLGQDSDLSAELDAVNKLQTSDDVKRWAAGHALQAEKLLPQNQTRNTGGSTDTLAVDPITGQVVVTSRVKNTQSPDSAASVAATIRGQNLSDARAREGNEIQRGAARSQVVETPDGVMIVDKGTGLARPAATMNGQPLGGKLPEAARKQAAGIDALGSAIGEYRDALKQWGMTDALSPDARAAMGTKYNNMMLQAKEAYNLGVLNGPDFSILQSVITDPRGLMGAITSNSALDKQASELDRIMQGTKAAVTGKPAQPKQGAKPAQDWSGWKIEKAD